MSKLTAFLEMTFSSCCFSQKGAVAPSWIQAYLKMPNFLSELPTFWSNIWVIFRHPYSLSIKSLENQGK